VISALPFRVFGIAARLSASPRQVVLFWNQWPVQSTSPTEVSPLLLLRSRFAVSTCLGCAVFLQRTACRRRLSCRPRPLVELHLPLESHPATPTRPPQRSGPLMGFCSLQHLRRFEVHLPRAKATRYVPPSGFGYPLDGLLPRIPCRFCFAPAALLGFTLRRFPLPEGLRNLSAERNPPTVGPALFLPLGSARPA